MREEEGGREVNKVRCERYRRYLFSWTTSVFKEKSCLPYPTLQSICDANSGRIPPEYTSKLSELT